MVKLTKERVREGWGAPDIRNYYNAVILSRIVEWAKENRWIKMEGTISTVNLGKIIWIPSQYRKLGKGTNNITRHALKYGITYTERKKWEYKKTHH